MCASNYKVIIADNDVYMRCAAPQPFQGPPVYLHGVYAIPYTSYIASHGRQQVYYIYI